MARVIKPRIRTAGGVPYVDSRDLAASLGRSQNSILRTIGLVGCPVLQKDVSGRKVRSVHLSLDAAASLLRHTVNRKSDTGPRRALFLEALAAAGAATPDAPMEEAGGRWMTIAEFREVAGLASDGAAYARPRRAGWPRRMGPQTGRIEVLVPHDALTLAPPAAAAEPPAQAPTPTPAEPAAAAPMEDTAPPLATPPVLREEGGRIWADSRDIAAQLGRAHKDVLRAWRELDCPEDFRRRSFAPCERPGFGLSHVLMNRDGCVFLISRLTGAKAAAYLLAYIARFNEMETELQGRQAASPPAPAVPAPLLDLIGEVAGLIRRANEGIDRERSAMQRPIALPPPAPVQVEAEAALARLADARGSFCIRDAAKLLKVKERLLFQWMADNGWGYARDGRFYGHAARVEAGELEHVMATSMIDGEQRVFPQTRVTARGLVALSRVVHSGPRAAPQGNLDLPDTGTG